MTRKIKIGIAVAAIVIGLPVLGIVGVTVLFIGMSHLDGQHMLRREISLPDRASLIIDGNTRSRSEHGFSQRAGYRPPGSADIEWFGDVSDGVEPQVYQAGPLIIVIDLPAACVFVRNPDRREKWKSLALVFP